MTNSNLIDNDFKILFISLPLLTLLSLTSVNSNNTMRQKSTKLRGFTRWTHLGGMMSVTVCSSKRSLRSRNLCAILEISLYETRRVGRNIPEDYSMLTERHIEKRHKINMMRGNIKGNVNCTYIIVAGRSTSKLSCKSSEQNNTAKTEQYQRDDISKQLSRALWKS